MKRTVLALAVLISLCTSLTAQTTIPKGWWRASLLRADGNTIDFNFEVTYKGNKPEWFIRNATERIPLTDIRWEKDTILSAMPVFESSFRLHYEKDGTLRGFWTRGTSANDITLPVVAVPNQPARFPRHNKPATRQIAGRWATTFSDDRGNDDIAIAEFKQKGNQLTGTFLTPTGDYRFLEGVLSGDSLFLSAFDGIHAFTFSARVESNKKITGGKVFSGPVSVQNWTAGFDPKASYSDTISAVYLRPGQEKLHFRFPDLDSNMVGISDPRFRNKVVIIQLMGSWCPNCMDETAFLSDFYNRNKQRGIEIIALAYEYSTDFDRSQKSLRKFQQHYKVQYPMLITGVKVADPARTEKTLPEITNIKTYPTTIIIGKDGKVKKIDNGFQGPGTGVHYEEYKKDFNALVDNLLKQ
ncbi:MAG: TlpA disulfide reductase family protein [Chitinophagaceae bacterium]